MDGSSGIAGQDCAGTLELQSVKPSPVAVRYRAMTFDSGVSAPHPQVGAR
jgi:hypothetical protein